MIDRVDDRLEPSARAADPLLPPFAFSIPLSAGLSSLFVDVHRLVLRAQRSFTEATQKQQSMTHIAEQMLLDAVPLVRRYLSIDTVVLDVASHLMCIISPRLRPVSTALLSSAEKKIMQDVVDRMISYNIALKQVALARTIVFVAAEGGVFFCMVLF